MQWAMRTFGGHKSVAKDKAMKAYLVTKSGAVGEYEAHPIEIRKMVRSGRYRQALPSERLQFLENREDMLRNERHPGLYDVLFIAPKQGNKDGYGIVQDAMREYFMANGVYLNRFDRGQKVVFCYHYPYYLMPYKDRDALLYTMFETTKFPSDWEEPMKAANDVYFPAKFCQDIARYQFDVHSQVFPHGIETRNFPFIHRKRTAKDPFTFLHYDAFKYRKGWDIVLTAFDEEFKGRPDVRLIMKTVQDATPYPMSAYPTVEVITGKKRPAEMRDILGRADCFVFPTRGEGFGMTPLEAMATGMPAIVPDAFGISEYFSEEFCIGLETRLEVAKYDNLELRKLDLGHFRTPTVASVRKAMREAFKAWRSGDWITQHYGLSMDCSDYARSFSLEKFAFRMANEVKAHCRMSGVEPEK